MGVKGMTKKFIFLIVTISVLLLVLGWVLISDEFPDKTIFQLRPTSIRASAPNHSTSNSSMPSFTSTTSSKEGESTAVECEIPQIKQQKYQLNKIIIQSFKTANDPKLQIFFALFGELQADRLRIEALIKPSKSDEVGLHALFEMLKYCVTDFVHNDCTQELIEQLQDTQHDNAAFWIEVANYHATRKNYESMQEAMQRAVDATSYDSYHFKNVMLYSQGLAGTEADNFTTNTMMAFGTEAARVVNYDALKYCKNNLSSRQEFRGLCISFAKTIEQDADLLIANLIGNGFLQKFYTEINDYAAADESAKMGKLLKINSDEFNRATAIAFNDERVLRFWLETLVQNGERKAAEMLINEVQFLSKNPDYQPCPATTS